VIETITHIDVTHRLKNSKMNGEIMGIRDPLPVNGIRVGDRRILEQSADWTMCSGLQKHFILDATRHVVKSEIPGDIVECGVWRGGMMQIAARTLLDFPINQGSQFNKLPKIWLYDTYDGMPVPDSPFDRDLYRGEHASHKLEREPHVSENGAPTVWCKADLTDVTQGMSATGYPASLVEFVVGRVEETIPRHLPESISILRVDTDWYSSTSHILNHMFDLVSPGGIIIFDDYDSWEGARTAVDEFLASRHRHMLLVRLDKGRICLKS
jgi:O-methyltransferase